MLADDGCTLIIKRIDSRKNYSVLTDTDSERKMPQFVYRKRVFLYPPTTGKNFYICAIAESSNGGKYERGAYALFIADCHHAVELDFSLDSPEDRKESLAKIDILAEVVNRFREALHTEAKAIKSAKKPNRTPLGTVRRN